MVMQASTIRSMSEDVQKSFVSFWDDARLSSVTSVLIEHYFPLTVRHFSL